MSFLPNDVLEQIYKRLTFDPDYVRFRSVCKSWRSAAPKRPQAPWLIHHPTRPINGINIFFKLSFENDDNNRMICVGSSLLSSLFNDMIRVGSSHGWMAMINPSSLSFLLFNPITKLIINLPKSPNMVKNRSCEHLSFHLSSNPGDSFSNDCLTFVIHNGIISFCPVRGNAWTILLYPRFKGHDIHSCFYDEKLYLISFGDVYVCDLDGLKVDNVVSASLEVNSRSFEINQSHLVESDGDLLIVLVDWFGDSDDGYKFEVFKIEWGKPVKLVKLASLNDKALFLCSKTSFALSASQFPGCRKDNIYYVWKHHDGDTQIFKLRVYNLMDGSDVLINDDAATSPANLKPCAWFTPSLM